LYVLRVIMFLKSLINYGADPFECGKDGITALHRACERGCIESVKYLLSLAKKRGKQDNVNWIKRLLRKKVFYTPFEYLALSRSTRPLKESIVAVHDRDMRQRLMKKNKK